MVIKGIKHFEVCMCYPEVQSVPGLFLRINAVDFGTTHRPHICLVTLSEIYQLQTIQTERENEKGRETEGETMSGKPSQVYRSAYICSMSMYIVCECVCYLVPHLR